MSNQKRRTRWSVLAFAIIMSIIMVGSVATGWLLQIAQQRDLQRQQQEALEPTPVPTFEPPVAVDAIDFPNTAVHANGIFTVSIPEPPEWGAVESSYDAFANRARLLMRNDLNVIEATAELPTQPVNTTADLDTLYTSQQLATSWRNYTAWRETSREQVTGENGREYLQIDFELEFGERTYVARQRSWTDGEQVYSVRVITPENATDLLVFLLENVADSFELVEAFEGLPISWSAYYDEANGHIIRYPNGWQLTDAAEGAPASIETQNVALRVETVDGESIDNEAAAEDYAAALPNVTEVLTTVETERDDLSGYTVSYQTRNLDGEVGSGLVVLLNGEETLHVANLVVSAVEADLNDPETFAAAVAAEEPAVAGPAPAETAETEAEGEETPAPSPLDQYVQVIASFQSFGGVRYAEISAVSSAPLTDEPAQPAAPNFGF